jgi:hypothetical protein
MFCSHNEVDLKPDIVSQDDADWVIVRCKACQNRVGERVRLIDLVDQSIKRAREMKQMLDDLMDPDWEPPS